MSLRRWATALADRLLPRCEPSRPVVLDCDIAAVQEAGRRLGVEPERAVATLAQAVRAAGGLAGAAATATSFTSAPRPRRAPEHLGALALLVLAATSMGESDGLHRGAYYQRLERLLGPPDRRGSPPYRGFAELCTAGFPALAAWMAEDQAGARGELLLPTDPRPHWIGWPVSQVVLRTVDRRRLAAFCTERAAQLQAGWDPAGVLLSHPAHTRLSRPVREMLADPQQRVVVSDALRLLVGRTRPAAAGSRRPPALRLRGRLVAQLDRRGVLRLAVGCDELEHRQPGSGPDGVRVMVPAAPSMLSVPLEWCLHAGRRPVAISLDDGTILEVLPAALVLFEAGPLGLTQVRRPGEGALWALTCRPEVDGEEVPAELPAGWRLLSAVDRSSLPRRGGGRVAPGLRFVGGLPLDRRAWLSDAPPAVAGPPELAGELLVDGQPAGELRDGIPLPLAMLAGRQGTFSLQAGALSRTLLLADRGMRRSHGSLCWRLDSPARAAAGPGDRPPKGVMPLLAGGDLVDGTAASARPQAPAGPWSRLQGTVWVLMADGSCEPVRPPLPEPWHAAVGYGAGSRWRLPAGAVWACQPQRQLVQLVDEATVIEGPLTAEAAAVVARCSQARVLGDDEAHERWQRTARETQVAPHA